jgi:DNA-directed RNA polymerase subunit delta
MARDMDRRSDDNFEDDFILMGALMAMMDNDDDWDDDNDDDWDDDNDDDWDDDNGDDWDDDNDDDWDDDNDDDWDDEVTIPDFSWEKEDPLELEDLLGDKREDWM